MPAPGKSRWVDAEEDAELEAKIRREKEKKRQNKAERARRLEEGRRVAAEAARADDGNHDDRPVKRRKLTPDSNSRAGDTSTTSDDGSPARVLRFQTGTWGRSRSVEEYDKLNDIEEGTYGWVARATQRATGKVVALKRLKLDPADRSGLPVTGLREIQILHDCKHRNVVALEEVVVGSKVNKMDKYGPIPNLSYIK